MIDAPSVEQNAKYPKFPMTSKISCQRAVAAATERIAAATSCPFVRDYLSPANLWLVDEIFFQTDNPGFNANNF